MESDDSVDISFYIGTRNVVECSVHYGRSVSHIYNLLISILEILPLGLPVFLIF